MLGAPKTQRRGRPLGSKNKRRGRPPKEKSALPSPHDALTARVNPKMRRVFILFLLFLGGLLGILGLFNLAGPLGVYYKLVWINLFGWAHYLIPFVLVGLAYFVLRSRRYNIRLLNFVGLTLFLLGVVSVLQLALAPHFSFQEMRGCVGGGYVGFLFSALAQKGLGLAGSMIVMIGLLVLGVLLMFNISLRGLALRTRAGFGKTAVLVSQFKQKNGEIKIKDVDGQEGDLNVEALEQEMAQAKEEGRPVISLPEDVAELKGMGKKRIVAPEDRGWNLPPLSLLKVARGKPISGNIRLRSQIIQKTLNDFGIEVTMDKVNVGPTVTQYTLRPATGVKLRQITTLQNDLALALAAHPIRIEAPIPGKSLVGIEIPNQEVALVRLREIIESAAFQNLNSDLKISLGKDVAGIPMVANLEKMPHLLLSGATGSGKSVCLNTIILSLLYQRTPRELKFILVDPKRVEMTTYNTLPHLLTPVVTDPKKTVNALKWTVKEMDRRFQVLSEAGKRNIAVYNSSCDPEARMPYIVVIIDELADLMAVAANEVEAAIVRLAQMARATGIHLVVATQRPSVDVITGLIKANITARIAFNVASQIDSRTIIDMAGAEKLLGNGDMLYLSSSESKPRRIQGALVSDAEIEGMVKFLGKQEKPEFVDEVTEKQGRIGIGGMILGEGEGEIDDELYDEAKDLVIQAGKASASLLQRRLKVGYARAARLLDYLEERGVVGPADGAKPRDVLVKAMTPESGYGSPSSAPSPQAQMREDLDKIRTLEDQERNNGNY